MVLTIRMPLDKPDGKLKEKDVLMRLPTAESRDKLPPEWVEHVQADSTVRVSYVKTPAGFLATSVRNTDRGGGPPDAHRDARRRAGGTVSGG